MKQFILFVIFINSLLFAQIATSQEKVQFLNEFSTAESNKAIKNIAAILLHMEHFVVSEEKRILKSINDNDKLPQNIRTIASAIINIQHKPLFSDLDKMKNIFRNEKSKVREQELAYIILNFKFKPKTKDKNILHEIINN